MDQQQKVEFHQELNGAYPEGTPEWQNLQEWSEIFENHTGRWPVDRHSLASWLIDKNYVANFRRRLEYLRASQEVSMPIQWQRPAVQQNPDDAPRQSPPARPPTVRSPRRSGYTPAAVVAQPAPQRYPARPYKAGPLVQSRAQPSREPQTFSYKPNQVEVTAFNVFKTIEGIIIMLLLAAFMLVLDWFTNRWFLVNVAFGYVDLTTAFWIGGVMYSIFAAFLMGSEWYLRVVKFFEDLTEGAEKTVRRVIIGVRIAVYLMIGMDAIATILPPMQFFTNGFDFFGVVPATLNNYIGLFVGLVVGVVLAGLTWLATAKSPELLVMAINLYRQRQAAR